MFQIIDNKLSESSYRELIRFPFEKRPAFVIDSRHDRFVTAYLRCPWNEVDMRSKASYNVGCRELFIWSPVCGKAVASTINHQ